MKALYLYILSVIACSALLFFISSCNFIDKVKKPNVRASEEPIFLYIKTGDSFDDVMRTLEENDLLIDLAAFEWVARRKKYPENVKPGRYQLNEGQSNNDIINILKSGKQTPVRVSFHFVRTIHDVAGRVSKKLELDSTELVTLFQNEDFLSKNGFEIQTAQQVLIPNTYEFWWNTRAEGFFQRMKNEYTKFWNEERTQKLTEIGLSKNEVYVLASIVQAEQLVHKSEWKRIAGLYMNRLKNNMLLQSDPTLVYAWGDFEIKRVLNKHKEIDSPYNTYRYPGLPPTPINIPEPEAIDAVLNYEKHKYLYMCAKEDFSHYHNFAETYQQHLNNAGRYQRALNKMGIY